MILTGLMMQLRRAFTNSEHIIMMMSNVALKLLAAERSTENVIDEVCTRTIRSLNYINHNSHVNERNVVGMQQVITMLDSAEYYTLQAQLLLATLK